MDQFSDVSLVLKRDLFNKIMEEVPEAGKRLLDCAKELRFYQDDVLLHWENIRWYSDDAKTNVGKFYRALDKHSESNDQFYLVELGCGSVESTVEGNYWDNPWDILAVRKLTFNDVGTKLDTFR